MNSDSCNDTGEPVTTQSPRRRDPGRTKHRRSRGARGIAGQAPRHGARALARFLHGGRLDRRTGIARDFATIKDGLAADRGGWTHTTTAERMLIEVAAAELLIVRALFSWAARQPSIVTETAEGPRLLGPLAKGFTSHAGALTRALAALGLRPDKIERLPDLATYLEQRASTAPAALDPVPPPATVDAAETAAAAPEEQPA